MKLEEKALLIFKVIFFNITKKEKKKDFSK